MKTVLKKISNVIEVVFGYGIMLGLFFGGLTFFGYVVALIAGGDTAVWICDFIYKKVYPHLVYWTSIIVLLGLLKMYLCGETALKAEGKKKQ